MGLDHMYWVFRVLDPVMKCKMWKFKNTVIFQLVSMTAVKAGHLNVRKHLSNWLQKCKRILIRNNSNTVT